EHLVLLALEHHAQGAADVLLVVDDEDGVLGAHGQSGTSPTSSPERTPSAWRRSGARVTSLAPPARPSAATKCGACGRSTQTMAARPSTGSPSTTQARRVALTSVTSSVRAVKCGPPSKGSMRSA